MERLKSILADKILDLSSGSGEEVKAKIDKIQRFRDFANALKSLMIKYPAIEDELISMVESGDFDTKVASSRVDTVIRLADTEAAQASRVIPQIAEPAIVKEEPATVLPVVAVEELEDDLTQEDSQDGISEPAENYINPDDIPMEIYEGEEEPLAHPEDVDFEEVKTTPEEEIANGYVSYEDVRSEDEEISDEEPEIAYDQTDDSGYIVPEMEEEDDQEEEIEEKPIVAPAEHVSEQDEEDDDDSDDALTEEEKAANRKKTIVRVLQLVGIILAVVAIIFIVKFIMSHWQTVLIILGIIIALAILIFWFKRKR